MLKQQLWFDLVKIHFLSYVYYVYGEEMIKIIIINEWKQLLKIWYSQQYDKQKVAHVVYTEGSNLRFRLTEGYRPPDDSFTINLCP